MGGVGSWQLLVVSCQLSVGQWVSRHWSLVVSHLAAVGGQLSAVAVSRPRSFITQKGIEQLQAGNPGEVGRVARDERVMMDKRRRGDQGIAQAHFALLP